MLQHNECYRRVMAIDVAPLVAALPSLSFVAVNIGSANPAKSPCAVVAGSLPPIFQQFVDSIGLGGKTRRLLVRKLEPRQCMPPHIDAWMPDEQDWRRFQIPITSHPGIIMRWPDDGAAAHLAPGWLYEVRYDRTHEVIHSADCHRVHLQVDQIDATI